jgi:hypothetical protein
MATPLLEHRESRRTSAKALLVKRMYSSKAAVSTSAASGDEPSFRKAVPAQPVDATPSGESEVLLKQEVLVLSGFLQHKS